MISLNHWANIGRPKRFRNGRVRVGCDSELGPVPAICSSQSLRSAVLHLLFLAKWIERPYFVVSD